MSTFESRHPGAQEREAHERVAQQAQIQASRHDMLEENWLVGMSRGVVRRSWRSSAQSGEEV